MRRLRFMKMVRSANIWNAFDYAIVSKMAGVLEQALHQCGEFNPVTSFALSRICIWDWAVQRWRGFELESPRQSAALDLNSSNAEGEDLYRFKREKASKAWCETFWFTFHRIFGFRADTGFALSFAEASYKVFYSSPQAVLPTSTCAFWCDVLRWQSEATETIISTYEMRLWPPLMRQGWDVGLSRWAALDPAIFRDCASFAALQRFCRRQRAIVAWWTRIACRKWTPEWRSVAQRSDGKG